MRLFTKKVGFGWFKRGPLTQYIRCGCHAYLLIWLKSHGERGASSHHPTFRHTFGSPIVVVIYSLTTVQYENKTNKKIITEESYNNNILQNRLEE